MSAGAGNGATGFEFFKIQIDLTQEGLGSFSLFLRHVNLEKLMTFVGLVFFVQSTEKK